MRPRFVFAVLLFFALASLPGSAQVAPSAIIGGLPLSVGAGFSDYNIDYCCGRRMIGVSAWADYTLFHGLGVTADGTSIFADLPSGLSKMRQDSIEGGFVYKGRPIFRVRPFAKFLGGIGSIDFPELDNNPYYTHDTFPIIALEGGGEYRLAGSLYAHADYQYQIWRDYHRNYALTPSGFTIGASYYFRGIHRRY